MATSVSLIVRIKVKFVIFLLDLSGGAISASFKNPLRFLWLISLAFCLFNVAAGSRVEEGKCGYVF